MYYKKKHLLSKMLNGMSYCCTILRNLINGENCDHFELTYFHADLGKVSFYGYLNLI